MTYEINTHTKVIHLLEGSADELIEELMETREDWSKYSICLCKLVEEDICECPICTAAIETEYWNN